MFAVSPPKNIKQWISDTSTLPSNDQGRKTHNKGGGVCHNRLPGPAELSKKSVLCIIYYIIIIQHSTQTPYVWQSSCAGDGRVVDVEIG